MKKKITISSGFNFHGQKPINVVVDTSQAFSNSDYPNMLVDITPSQARRINQHFCGIPGCICGSSPVIRLTETRFAVQMPEAD